MRIVCAVDGSEHSQWGIQALEALASREPEQVALMHVVDKPALQALAGKNPIGERRALAAMEKAGGIVLRDAARSARVALGQAATAPRSTIQTILAHGPLAKTIAREARRLKADLIIMGSRGLSDIHGFLLGSISRQVASMAPCSVWVVKQPTHKLLHVTLAIDDSKPSRAAALVNSVRNAFIKEGFLVVTQIQMDHVIETIVKHIEANRDELLVIGSRDLTKSERLYLGSVSESLLRHAPCSVLIVRGARA
jgi:nucleotide-binding universal stress UspA family protein